MISPISSFFKMRLIIAVVLVFFGFFFIGMLHRAFADCLSTCSYWQSIWSWDDIEQSYYPDAQSAFDACYSSHGSSCDCGNASQAPYNYRCRVTGFYYVACQDCDDSEPDGSCDNACDCEETSSSDVCLSDSNVDYTGTTQEVCSYTCKCPDYTGEANYNFETCSEDDCDAKREAAIESCGSESNIILSDVDSCTYSCSCFDVPELTLPDCGIYDYVMCTCVPADTPCSVLAVISSCPLGRISTNWETCVSVCKTCESAGLDCNEACTYGGVQTGCDDSSSAGQIGICVCNDAPEPEPPKDPDRPKTCSELESNCQVPPCTFWCNSGSDGYSAAYNCDCSNNPDPDPSDPRDPDNPADTPPSDDPSDPGDGNGWLASIKSNTDTLVEQGRESNGWLEGIKKNTDDSLDLDKDRNDELKKINESLKNIAKNQYASSTGSGISSLTSGGSDDGSDDGTVSGTIGTSVDGGYDIDGTGYGESPTDDDLPTGEDLDTSFGTFTPSETPSYIDAAESALQSLRPVLASTVCTFDLVFKYESGLVDIDYSETFDLCQYEAIFNMIGNVLIALASFFNLYKLAFG